MREKFAFKLLRVNILFTWVILFGITLNNYGQIFSSVESDKETGAEMAAQVKSQIGLYELPTTNSPLSMFFCSSVKKIDNFAYKLQNI